MYRAINGGSSIKIISSKELELTDGSDRFVCEYSRDIDQVRVVIAVFGTKQAEYFTIIPDGLRNEKEVVLYRPGRYEEAMREVNDARRQKATNTRLLDAAQRDALAEVRAALKEGAQVNVVTERQPLIGDTIKGFTALHFSAKHGNIDLMKLLLASGADINAQDASGSTPLMIAFTARRGSPDANRSAVEFLVERGADRDIRDKQGRTVYDLAQDNSERRRWLGTEEDPARHDADVLARITSVLQSRHPFFGEERSVVDKCPFQITFDSFDEHTGRCTGTMNYYSPSDGAVLTFEGSLQGAVLTLSHTGAMKEGASKPSFRYTLRLNGVESLEGSCVQKDAPQNRVWVSVDLNEARRKDMERKVAG